MLARKVMRELGEKESQVEELEASLQTVEDELDQLENEVSC